ncbi:MAG: methionine synthase [Clostridia bacterium]|nr:methionine synthase [Clostridia bacterium]
MVEIIKADSSQIIIDKKEIAVYMGYYSVPCDCSTEGMIFCCESEFLKAANFVACCEKVPVKIIGDTVDLGFKAFSSKSLAKNLSGCDYAYVMAATTGIEAHRLIERNGVTSPLKGVITDCVGSAAIEAFCDKINLSFECPDFLRPRFSPGYGDLSLEYQRDIVEFLQTKKNIGMVLTEGLMMVPVKSVTAIIGIGKEKNKCTGHGCMTCKSDNCPYR